MNQQRLKNIAKNVVQKKEKKEELKVERERRGIQSEEAQISFPTSTPPIFTLFPSKKNNKRKKDFH
jgi:hypothetical protein